MLHNQSHVTKFCQDFYWCLTKSCLYPKLKNFFFSFQGVWHVRRRTSSPMLQPCPLSKHWPFSNGCCIQVRRWDKLKYIAIPTFIYDPKWSSFYEDIENHVPVWYKWTLNKKHVIRKIKIFFLQTRRRRSLGLWGKKRRVRLWSKVRDEHHDWIARF